MALSHPIQCSQLSPRFLSFDNVSETIPYPFTTGTVCGHVFRPFPVFAIVKKVAVDECAHGPFVCVSPGGDRLWPRSGRCKVHVLSQAESLPLCRLGRFFPTSSLKMLVTNVQINRHCHVRMAAPLPAVLVQLVLPRLQAGAEALLLLVRCRPTPASSVWSSTPTSSCPSTRRRLWRCTGARSATKCRPTCTP